MQRDHGESHAVDIDEMPTITLQNNSTMQQCSSARDAKIEISSVC